MSTQQNFRTAFNGFNREDVVNYIEYLNAQHAAEISQLNSELEFLRSKPETQDDASAPEEQEGCTEELETLRAQNAALKAQLVAELEAARNQQFTFESKKNDELEAYRRAERTERMAQERANLIYQKANGVIADATCQIANAAEQLGLLSESVMEQLEQLRQAVSGSNQVLKDASACMYALRPEEE